jgi:putative sporulation protein YtxC
LSPKLPLEIFLNPNHIYKPVGGMPVEHSVQLATQDYRESVWACLCELREKEQLPIKVHELQQGKRWLIDCRFHDSAHDSKNDQKILQKIHQYHLASALADTILQHWEKEHVRRLIRKKNQLLKNEWQMVIDMALDYINNGLGKVKDYSADCKTTLVAHILSCLEHNATFEIEGFLHFRTQEYKGEVNKAVEYALTEYVIEKEYLNFILLLKHFVDNQEPRLEHLHVGITPQGNFHLFDNEGVKVTHQFLGDYQLDNVQELGFEDLLVSALISIAPRQITLHIRYEGYQDTLTTIRSVFGDRVHDCQGCFLCEKF